MIDVALAMDKLDKKIKAALTVIGAEGVSWASEQLRTNGSVVTSNLINSLAYSTDTEQGGVKGNTTGTPIALANKQSVRIGTNVVYGPRVEFGFTGTDSLGRSYHQPAKPYLLSAIQTHKDKIIKILALANG